MHPMESASRQPPPIKVYCKSRWPPRVFGTAFLAIGIVVTPQPSSPSRSAIESMIRDGRYG
jgi:hypothetical protein